MAEERRREDVADAPARLTVTQRTAQNFGMREVHLLLDGELFATLLPGQEVTREVAPGVHRLRANNTFVWKTAEFEARPGEHVRFVTGNRSGFGSWMVWILGAGPLYVVLEREA